MSKKSTILIIDDDPINVKVVYNMLKDDYQCISAVNGEQGIDLARTYIPDIILLDIMMKGMDGYEVCRRIKDDLALGRTSIFFLTSKDKPEDIVKGLDMGAIHYLVKPVDYDVLRAIIRRFLDDKESSHRTYAKMFDKQKIKAIGNLIGQFMHIFGQAFSNARMSVEMVASGLKYEATELPTVEEYPKFPRDYYMLVSRKTVKRFVDSLEKAARHIDAYSAKLQRVFAVSETIIESGQLCPIDQALNSTIKKIVLYDKPEKIVVVTQVETCGHIRMKPEALESIVRNILLNSFASMESGGDVSVKLYRERVMPSRAEYLGIKSGFFAKIEVVDTGRGFHEEYVHRLTEPGFSLEKDMQGKGFGLYEVRARLNAVGGAIDYHSKPNKGTTTYLYIPVFDMSYMEEAGLEINMPRRKEVALLVDDQKLFVHLLGQIMEGLGYKVVGETNPRAALEIFRVSPSSFDIVVLDQHMPIYNGDKLAIELRKVRADIPILIWTSYAVPESVELRNVVFAQKPAKPESVAEKLAEAKKAFRIES